MWNIGQQDRTAIQQDQDQSKQLLLETIAKEYSDSIKMQESTSATLTKIVQSFGVFEQLQAEPLR